ncbi:STAS domain-containing protein [Amycolatopsis vancoresmycina]|uniref:Anti-sigma factor antagonist n=1 Tax=Amycolatopsis vancoresmycina DSM 44592 TaxID=1292037 RepID=R1GGN0_9PSEU|nr:STAS domain-containing protein [Amycolatopsis vancoresmycina]EOD70412.1 anti-sigma-factor antagonist [Amycolatopsis vancoresmycina DSM 44592]
MRNCFHDAVVSRSGGDYGRADLTVSITRDDGVVLATVSGEIDLATARTFARHLESTLTGPPAAVIADLGQVAFLSSSGLAALQIFAQAATSAGVAFCLVSAQRTMLRHLQLTALDRDLTIKPTVADARTWLSNEPTPDP